MHRKRIVTFLMAAALLLALAGCKKDPQPTLSPETGAPSVTTVPNGTTAPTGPITVDIDMSAPWQTQKKGNTNHPNEGTFSEAGYYYTVGNYLFFMDTANGISVILCHKAGCSHDERDCEAYLPNCMVLFYCNGHLYYNKLVPGDPGGIHLFRRSADGTGEEKVCALGQSYASDSISIYPSEYMVSEKAVYFTAYIMETIQHDDGTVEIRDRDMILVRLDPQTGKQQELGLFASTQLRLIGCRDDALLYYTMQLPDEKDMFSDEYAQIQARLPARLQVWSAAANASAVLLEKPFRDFSYLSGLHRGKLIYSAENGERLMAFDLVSGEDGASELSAGFVPINDRYVIDSSTHDHSSHSYDKLLDLQTGQYLASELEGADLRAKAVTDSGCVMEFVYYGTPYINDLGQTVVPRLREILAYVSFDALADGLQNADLLTIRDIEP